MVAVILALTWCQAFADYADSSDVRVDTRTLTMTQLVVSGPSSVPWGQEAAYTAMLNYQGAAAEDVTSQCEWFVSGGPPVTFWLDMAYMNGNGLNPKVVSTVPLLVSAKITRNNAKIASNAISVTVTEGTGMNIGMSWPSDAGPTYVQKSGVNFVWHYAANASGQALMKSGVTVAWFLDGVQVATGAAFSQNFTGMPGTKELKVVATDTAGRTGQATGRVTFNAPPVANEPVLVSALDPGVGDLIGEDPADGYKFKDFKFDSLKTANGLIVVTHGLYGSKDDKWLQDLATFIRFRLEDEGKPMPNIVVYGWGAVSNPSQFWSNGSKPDLAVDASHIQSIALDRGRELAAWFRKEMESGRGNILPGAPVHLIGHSAGGFVMGECAWQLGSRFQNLRVTMLDTPFPVRKHLTDVPGSGRKLDRYASSALGLEPWSAWSVPCVPGTYDYVVWGVEPTFSAHSYSHKWYQYSVSWGDIGAEGFGWSPFMLTIVPPPPSGSPAPQGGPPLTPAPPLSPVPPLQTDTPLTGFTTFGIASAVTDGFLLTEGIQANSGIVLANYAMPVGAQSISFRFQFTGVGDGDFLVASFGENPPIGYGSDNATSEGEEVTVNMPVDYVAGQQGDLAFRLVSRGSQNAMVTLKGITLTEIDDADMDGLTNAQEAIYGTNPLLADSDGDGLTDVTEINTTLTNPMLADTDGDGINDGDEVAAGTDPLDGSSRFAVKSCVKAGADFTITWSSVTSRHYRIIRSTEPSFDTYDVVVSGVLATPPQQSYTDTGGAIGTQMFYRVELEP